MVQPGEWPPNSPAKARILASPGKVPRESAESDSEEEALRRQIALMEAKLKLKQLQKKRKAEHSAQVPVSPPQRVALPPKTSPTRIQLGVDKGRRAQQVSLGRPSTSPSKPALHKSLPRPPAKPFSQRLAESRASDLHNGSRQEEKARLQSKGFNQDTTPTLPPPPSHSPSRVKALRASAELYDPYSGFKLTNRLCPHAALAQHFAGKNIYDLPSLFKQIVAPEFEPPDVVDWVLLGVIAAKSTPRVTQRDNGKYLLLTITDLKHELSLFLFGSAFEKYWKVAVGHVVAILNPAVMKPNGRDTTRFSLNLSTSDDLLLEIGKSKDLKFCQSLKRDGKPCGQWVDGRKTEYCDYHVDQSLRKSRSQRMDVSTGLTPHSPKKLSRSHFSAPVQHDVCQRDGGAGGHVFLVKRSLREDDNISQVQARERIRQQAEKREREREIAKRLAAASEPSMGGVYLRQQEDFPPPASRKTAAASERNNVFSADIVRRIGFDPTRQNERMKSTPEPSPNNPKNACPNLLKKVPDDDDDEDLEIVMS